MCGICGEIRFDGAQVDAGRLAMMRDQLTHRGPDSAGVYVAPDGRTGLGFRRLRIIDLSLNANQPMTNEDGSVHVVFNGEIYNFMTLRRGLEMRGHRFKSHSDTETIVHLYEERGADCIADLDGMFAIAIWDDRPRRLTLARDRAGKKPLFYVHTDRLLAFASEMKAFFAVPDVAMDVDTDVLPDYLLRGYVPGPSTFYKGVRQVEPGCLMTIEAGGRAAGRRYWRLEFPPAREAPDIPAPAAVAAVRDHVTRAVQRRLVSDVPLGAFLSGGLDSTIVVGVMSRLTTVPVKTFSIGFEGDPAYDETAYARIAAKKFSTEHTEFLVAPSAVDLVDTLVWHHDGPFGDSSAIPTYLVSKLARQHVTVALTGDGGDEVFAGYRRFRAALVSERIPGFAAAAGDVLTAALPHPRHERSRLAELRRFVRARRLRMDDRVTMWNSVFFDELPALVRTREDLDAVDIARRGVEPPPPDASPLGRLLYANFTSYLPDDLLVKTDRSTMANSLEARSPFLDRELVEYVARLPDRFKLRGRVSKAILRDAFADLIPPDIDRRPKMGFGVPLGTWFRGQLRDYVRDVLLAPGAMYRDSLSGSFVERLVEQHLSGRANVGPQLWALVTYERWLQLLPAWRRAARLPSPSVVTTPASSGG